jgi:predicted enzyme related to lactoylglutathione lyase
MANAVNWFEIPVKDIEEAKKFYGNVFGVEFMQREFFGTQMAFSPMDMEAPNISGALVQGETYEPSQAGSLVYFTCEDVNIQIEKIKENGGTIVNEKTDLGENMGFIGHFIDPHGNRVGLHSEK